MSNDTLIPMVEDPNDTAPGGDLPAWVAGPFIQVHLILDKSWSMRQSGDIVAVNQALQEFATKMRGTADGGELVRNRADITVVSFGGNVVKEAGPVLARDFVAPTLYGDGNTPMGEAIETSLDIQAERRKEYRDRGVKEYVPLTVVITDGAATDRIEAAARRVRELADRKQLNFYAFGTGNADMSKLKQICPDSTPPALLSDGAWTDLFDWVRATTRVMTQAAPGSAAGTQTPATGGWATVLT